MFKLALNAGHGYNTAGKRCSKLIDKNETREYVLNKIICDFLESKLKNYNGIEVLRIDNGDETSIEQRAKKANDFNADLYLSVHHNAGIKGGSGGGIVAYVYTKVDNTTKEWQKAFYDSLIAKTNLKGNRATPLSSANFGELRLTKMPAVLLECGFMDSTIDTPIILTEDFAKKCADGLLETLVRKQGLTLKETPKAEDTNTQTQNKILELLKKLYELLKGFFERK